MLKLITSILGTPAVLIGIFSFLGLAIQGKKLSDIITGSTKAVMGFLVLGIGAGVIVDVLGNFGELFNSAFHLKGVVPTNEAIVALATKTLGSETAIIMVLGMLFNILLARFTPLKYIFLTGHHILFMACLISAMLSLLHLNFVVMIIIGGFILGSLMIISPAILQSFTKRITKSEDIAMGHFGSTGYLVSALVGKMVGKGSKSTEELTISKNLMFLRDTPVAITITMLLFFFVVSLFAQHDVLVKLADKESIPTFIIIQSIKFSAGVFVILTGVRMLISEIIPAFKGIAEKIVPNSKPALDCPMVFPYAPNAVIIGFISSFAGGIISMFVLSAVHLTVIIPGLLPHFFTGAAAGVYGNSTGGLKGSVWGAFANGVIISFLPALLFPMLGVLGFEGTTFGDADFGIVGILMGVIVNLLQ